MPDVRLPPRPYEHRAGMTPIGVARDEYNASVEGRPRRFPTTDAYLDWCVRADKWAASHRDPVTTSIHSVPTKEVDHA